MRERGYYGDFGGAFIPEILVATFDELTDAFEAARADPNSTVAANNLAWILATSPAIANPSPAIAHAERAVQLAPYPDPSTLDTLAVAYAAGSDFDRAVSHAREALELATAAGYRSLARDIRKRLAFYEQGLPYREDPAVHPVGG